MIDSKIFNTEKTDYGNVKLFLGEQDSGLFDTINKQYPEIWKLLKTCKKNDWDENEFDYSSCNQEFKLCSKSNYDMMLRSLIYQWEADTIAGMSITPILAPFITSSELWAAIIRVGDQEVLHAATYSEIVRNSFDDPNVIIEEVRKVEESMARLKSVSRIFSEAYEASHKYALGLIPNNQETYNVVFMTIVALLALERIQFMASFAVTFAICDTGLFQPIGKAVQKIAQDEFEVHAQLDKEILRNEMRTERGKIAYEQCKGRIKELLDEIVAAETEWIDYLFSEGRELVGLNSDVLRKWTLFCAKDVYNFLDIKNEDIKFPRENPLKFMEKWLDISKTQPAPQEQDIAQYKVNVLRRTDENVEFDVDF